MPRYAELPGGKRLSFDDKATDREIQRAVRRELGLTQEDLIDELAKISDSIDALITETAPHRDEYNEVTSALSGLAVEMKDAAKAIAKTQDKTVADLAKAMSRHAKLARSMHDTAVTLGNQATNLNARLDAVMKHTVAAFEDIVATANNMSATVERSTARLDAIMKNLVKATEALHASRRVTKRAYRNRDGSWTMECIPSKLQ